MLTNYITRRCISFITCGSKIVILLFIVDVSFTSPLGKHMFPYEQLQNRRNIVQSKNVRFGMYKTFKGTKRIKHQIDLKYLNTNGFSAYELITFFS